MKTITPAYPADVYTYRVLWSVADQEHVGRCTEFPSLSHLDATPEAALSGIIALVTTVLTEMRQAKEEPPIPMLMRQSKR